MSAPDLLVIGSGVIGSSIAYHAASAGLDVLVLDRQPPAYPHSASWASAGGVRRQGRDEAEAALAATAIERWRGLAAELDADLHYRRGGNLQVAETEDQATELAAFAERQRAHGLADVELLGRDEVAALVPGISPAVVAGSYAPDDGQADPVRTTRAFAAAARRCGARYRTDVPVREVMVEAGAVRGVRTAHETIRAGATVLAAGAGSADLAATAGVRLPARPGAKQMLRTASAPADVLRPVLGGVRRTLSLKQLPDGSFLIGGGWPADIDAGTGKARLVAERVTANRAEAVALLPMLAQYPVVESWYGIESESIDGLPFLGAVPGRSGLLVATGFSGHGFALAPAVGSVITSYATGASPSTRVDGLLAARIAEFDAAAIDEFVAGPAAPAISAG
jgi:glycine/D-amino acid oxidase-like deaminating enzyme